MFQAIARRALPALAATLITLLSLPAAAADSAAAALDGLLAQHAGKVVYLDFWASWCVPCRKSFPWLNELAGKHPDDLVVIAINVDNERAAADRFLEKFPAGFPVVYDPEGTLAARYRLEGMPSSVLLGRDGKEAHRHIGFREERIADYEMVLNQLLRKP